MRHRVLSVLLIVVLCVSLVVVFASCGDDISKDEVNDLLDDTKWSAWEVTKLPTTTEDGTAQRKHKIDKTKVDTLTIPKISDDNYTTTVIKEATCLATGSSKIALKSNPLISFVVETPIVPHTFSEWQIDPNDKNKQFRECSVCHTREVRDYRYIADIDRFIARFNDVNTKYTTTSTNIYESNETITSITTYDGDIIFEQYVEDNNRKYSRKANGKWYVFDNNAKTNKYIVDIDVKNDLFAKYRDENVNMLNALIRGDNLCFDAEKGKFTVSITYGDCVYDNVIDLLDNNNTMLITSNITYPGTDKTEKLILEVKFISDMPKIVPDAGTHNAHLNGSYKQPTTYENGTITLYDISDLTNEKIVTLPDFNEDNYTIEYIIEPTCTKDGVAEYTLKSDTSVVIEVAMPKCHKYGEWVEDPNDKKKVMRTCTRSGCKHVERKDKIQFKKLMMMYQENYDIGDSWITKKVMNQNGVDVVMEAYTFKTDRMHYKVGDVDRYIKISSDGKKQYSFEQIGDSGYYRIDPDGNDIIAEVKGEVLKYFDLMLNAPDLRYDYNSDVCLATINDTSESTASYKINGNKFEIMPDIYGGIKIVVEQLRAVETFDTPARLSAVMNEVTIMPTATSVGEATYLDIDSEKLTTKALPELTDNNYNTVKKTEKGVEYTIYILKSDPSIYFHTHKLIN